MGCFYFNDEGWLCDCGSGIHEEGCGKGEMLMDDQSENTGNLICGQRVFIIKGKI